MRMWQRSLVIKLGLLTALAFAGVLFGPSSFGPEPRSAEAAFLAEVTKLLASDAEADDIFGSTSAAVSGDFAVIGAIFEDAGGSDAGAAYVFRRDQGGTNNWGEVRKLSASDAEADDRFGISVAISGDTVIVGAYQEDAGGSDAGAVYVFQRSEGGADNWGEVKKLTASDAEALDEFGYSVAVSGDTAVVGARSEDTAGTGAGAAYVFERNQGGADNWGEAKKLTASDGDALDNFGISVAVNGDTAVVGRPRCELGDCERPGNSDTAGAAYVFQRDDGGADNWGEVKKLTASDAQANDLFGFSVAVTGDTALVGAFGAGNYSGAAYVFERDEGGAANWGEVTKITGGLLFGFSVAVTGDTAAVGAVGEDTWGSFAGAAYVFQRDEGGTDNWGQVKKLIGFDTQAGDNFGASVAVGGDTAVIGAPGEDAGGNNAGAAYVFHDLPKQSDPGDTDGDGCSDQRENGLDETLGGLRNYKNRWDYSDVNGDQIVDLSNDILGVIQHYAPTGTEPEYDVNFDRGPSAGPNAWNMTAPDGVIDLSNDILGVVAQYFHDCR